MAYPTVAEIKTFILSTTGADSTLSDAIITLALDAFISALETDTGVNFVPVTEIRRFDGDNNHRLNVDPFISITSINIELYDATLVELAATTYFAPIVSTRPFTEIHLRNNHGNSGFPIYIGNSPFYTCFPSGNSNILVNASWGWAAAVPSDISFAIQMYMLTLQNTLKLETINYLSSLTIRDVEETDRRIAFQLIAPEKFLPKYITWNALIKRYSGSKRTRARRGRRIMIQ